MRIYDSHVHIYPDKIAAKAAENVGKFYGLHMDFNGTIDVLKKSCRDNGIEKCLVHSVATTHDQVSKINDFIKQSVDEADGAFIGFCTLHPSMESKEIEAEIDRVIAMGLKGVKLHPDCQKFAIDDPHAMEMYEIIDGRLPILLHTGDRRYDYSGPERFRAAAMRFPRQKMIGAHFGGYSEWDLAVKTLAGIENIWYDECSSLAFITPEKAKEYITELGEDRIFFGTDYPMWRASDEIERLNRIDLTDEQREKIFWKNLHSFLDLS